MFIPNPYFSRPGSKIKKIPDPRSRIRIKAFKYFYHKKLFLSSRKYHPGCSSRIRDPDSRSGSGDQKSHQIPDTVPQHCVEEI